MNKVFLLFCLFLPAMPLAAKEDKKLSKEKAALAKEIQGLTEDISKTTKKTEEVWPKLQDAIKNRGYLESQLLKAQDPMIQAINNKTGSGATTISFYTIRHYLMSTWKLKAKSEEEAMEKYIFPIISDQQFSWQLRSHYLNEANSFRRNYRGPKKESMQKFKDNLLLLAKRIEAEDKEEPELKATALGVIVSIDLNDAERHRVILKNLKSQNKHLRKKAIFAGSFPVNLNEEILEELLHLYEEKASFSKQFQKELRHAMYRVGAFAKTPRQQTYKAKAIKRLEALKNKKKTEKEQIEIDDLIDDMTRESGKPPKRQKRYEKKGKIIGGQ